MGVTPNAEVPGDPEAELGKPLFPTLITLSLGWPLVWLLFSVLAIDIVSGWSPAVSIAAVSVVLLVMAVGNVRGKDRKQRTKNWIVLFFTAFAYIGWAPIYTEQPYEAVGRWIGTFTVEMFVLSGLLWLLLKAWKDTLLFMLLLSILVAGLLVVLFFVGQLVQSPFRTILIVLLVVIIALLYRISQRLKGNA